MFRIVANYYDDTKLDANNNPTKVTRLLFDNAIPDEDLKLINPKLTLEDNEPGSLDFTLPTFHRFYGLMGVNVSVDEDLTRDLEASDKRPYFLNNRDTQIIVYKDGEWYWEGFPSDYSRSFNGDYTIHCDGAFAYLDSTRTDFGQKFTALEAKVDDYVPSGDPALYPTVDSTNNTTKYENVYAVADTLWKVLDEYHNDHIRSSVYSSTRLRHKKIYLGLILDQNNNLVYDCNLSPIEEGDSFCRTFNHETCYEAIQEKFIKALGGHIAVTRVYGSKAADMRDYYNEKYAQYDQITDDEVAEGLLALSYHQNYNSINNNLRIDFGENILDYTDANAFKDIATVIIPHGDTQSENDPFYVNNWPTPNTTFYAHLGWEHYEDISPYGLYPVGDPRIFMGDPPTYSPNAPADQYPPADTLKRRQMQKKFGYAEKVVEFTNVIPRRYRIYHQETRPGVSGDAFYEYIDDKKWTNLEYGYEALAKPNGSGAVTIPETWWTEGNLALRNAYKQAYLNALRILGWDYLHNKQFNGITIEISAIDLSSRFGVENYTEFHILDQARCTSRPHGMINKSYPITKMEIPLDSVVNMKFTLNHTQRTLTGKIADSK